VKVGKVKQRLASQDLPGFLKPGRSFLIMLDLQGLGCILMARLAGRVIANPALTSIEEIPMPRLARVFILLSAVLALGWQPATTRSQAAEPPGSEALAQSRLVVFETFMRPG
jgi:hypothetical protein